MDSLHLCFLPAASSHIPIEFYFDVEILEKHYPAHCSCKSYRGGTVDASNNVPRIITFSSMFEVAGRHSMLLNNIGDMNISAYPQIASVSGSNLVHGSVYEFDISFKDAANNDRERTIHSKFYLILSTPTLSK